MAELTVPRARKLVLAMKPETTAGTDIFAGTYVAADVIPAFAIRPIVNLEEIQSLATKGLLGRQASVIGRESGGVTFSMNIRGRGAAYATGTRPEIDLPLRGCGLSSTVDAAPGAEKVTYVPTDTMESMTVYCVQQNGRTVKLAGCLGTVAFRTSAGGVLVADVTMLGLLQEIEAPAGYVSGTLSGTPQYPVAKSALFQIGTENFAARIASLGVSLGNLVTPVPSTNAVGGIAGYIIADRDPRVSIDPEDNPIASYDWYDKWRAATLQDCSFQVGTVQYNRAKFSFTNLQISGQSYTERDGLTALQTVLLSTIAAGNDDFSLVFD